MLSERSLVQQIESHIRSLVKAVSVFRYWHERYLEWAEQQKNQRLEQMEAERDQALADGASRCEQTVHQAEEQHQARIAELEARRSQRLTEAQAHYEQTVVQAEQNYQEPISRAADAHQKALAALKREHEDTVAQAEQAHQVTIAEGKNLYEQMMANAKQDYETALERLQEESQEVTLAAAFSAASFSDPTWSTYRPILENHHPPAVTRIGLLRESSPWGDWEMPAFLPVLGGRGVLLKVRGSSRTAALAIQSLLLRLLASLPPGKLRFTMMDPVGLGQNAAPFMHLVDYDEQLITGRAWTEPQQIEQRLANLTEHMENVIQQYLRNRFATIEEYNAKVGEIAEPYRALVVFDFPTNFTEAAARRLVSIAQNGPRCGVYPIVMVDTAKPLPDGFNLADLEQNTTIITWDGNRFIWQDEDFKDCLLELDTPPEADLFTRIVVTVGETAKAASKVEVPFERIAPPRTQWWEGDSCHGLRVPLGPAGAHKVQHLELGQGTAQHALVAGKTGSGKSALLHALITNLALTYSPEQVELYLIDFKKGVEFKTYAACCLPHARVVAIESEREFGLSVLQGLDAELKRRGDLFRAAGVDHIADYRQKAKKQLPRLLLLVDEFQEFFTEDDAIASQASQILDRLVRQGRAFGLHVLLGSQTLAGAYTLARSTIDQMAVRIALQCSEADSRLILADDNPAARLLSRPGEAIYNNTNGLMEGNSRFQVAWLPDDQRDQYLDQLQNLAEQTGYHPSRPQIVFEGNAPAEIENNRSLRDLLAVPNWPTTSQQVLLWLGEPIAIKDPTAAYFHRQSGSNLLIVGQNSEAAMGMVTAALTALAAQHKPKTAVFRILDFGGTDTPYADALGELVSALPHTTTVGRRRQLSEFIGAFAAEVQQRLDSESDEKTAFYLILYGLHRARELRQEDSLGFSGFGSFGEEPAAPNLAQQFATILRDGPEVGIHTLIWCDTVTNLNRSLDRRALREFALRVVFQMSAEDSTNLIDSPLANKLGMHRVLFHDDEEGRLEKFRPYGLPSREWLKQVKSWLSAKSDTS